MRLSSLKRTSTIACVTLLASWTSVGAGPAAGPLRVHPTNPRYFTDGTKTADGSLKAVYLTGSHTWDNLVDMDKADPPASFDFGAYLNFLERHGHNFIRLWTWDSVAWDSRANGKLGKDFAHQVAPLPWARTGPGKALDGKPKFDLTKFNPEYFDRLRTRVRAAGDRGIYVSVMLFEGWGLSHANRRVPAADGWAYRSHPFHPDNNVNGITGDLNGDGNVLEIHSLASPAITALQEAYIRKVVDTVNDLDNVLYEVINEGGNKEWDWWVVQTVKDYERTKPKQHPVGITGHGGEKVASMLASPADWISPGSQDGYGDPAPAWDGRKVSLLDTDHIWGVGGNHGWVWRSFLRGHNPIFMDPYDGTILGTSADPRWEPVRAALGVVRRLADHVNLALMTPHGDLASSGFCLADPGKEYVVYLPEGGQVTLDLTGAQGAFAVEWVRPVDGATVSGESVLGGEKRTLKAPFNGDAVVHIRAERGAARVRLVAPEDGGTPREASRIGAVGSNEFQVRACAEEGPSPLTHAVSRVDLICRNDGPKPQDVTLHLDLSGDGRRTNADNSSFGGMSTRDFLFLQPPGRPWRQIEGRVSGWVCTVRFTAPPGETKVGLSPWYTYADYLHFVRAIPEHPHLKKTRLATSDGGREHWELTITDPGRPLESKRTIFWHAREHAYETFSSYAVEGLVGYLLSDTAADLRRRYQIVLHPMTNVDGVAQGYEYRGGYDYPQPRRTATGKLTFDAIDRLRPDFAVTWHNWIAPRDVDCLFDTDSEEGHASRRAWDLFMQRFPSPRGVGHRWESESNPLAKNWFGRTLRESNVHEYAMKRYGTRVWGWEMPWWDRTEGEPTQIARKAGADFGRAFLATLDATKTGPSPAASQAPPVAVPRWEMHEFELHGRSHVDNPFRDAALVGEFTSPSGKTIVAEGFYDGGDTWRLRFTPEEEGEWRYLLRGEGVELHQRGRLRCTAPHGHGFIRVHPDNPYAFACADGTAFFPMGDTCYGLYSDSPITPALRAEYLKIRRSQRFNFVRLGVIHSPTHGQTDPNYWPWGGTPEKPDLDRFNPRFFHGFDAVLAKMQAVGMNAELIVLNYYLRPFTDVKAWTPQRERQWLRYITARYAAFPNLFLWTIANEYETHADGRYRLDAPDDPEWAKATARFIKQHDPYRHLVTVHPVISASARGASPRDPFDPPWRIGEFFGKDDAMDVLSQQTGQFGEGVVWDEQLLCWTGDAPDLVASLRADRRYGRPVLNTENGYEYLRGHPTEKKQVHHTDKVRHSAWRIVCAGGYFAAGFHGTIGHSDAWNRIDAPNHYTFVVQDEGAARQLGLLYDFFASLPFWRMQPFDGAEGDMAVSLAEPGRVYVIYLPRGGKVSVDLSKAQGSLVVRWLNPRSGDATRSQDTSAGAKRSFQPPFAGDAVLCLEAK